MEDVVINDDEMMGYIIRKASEDDGVALNYDDVKTVLDAQDKFFESKGLIEAVDEINTKDGAVSTKVYQFKDEVRAVSLSIDESPIFLGDNLWCSVRDPGELVLMGEMGLLMYDLFKQRVLKGTKHSYTVTLSDGKMSSGYLHFTSSEMRKGDPLLVEITAEITE